MSVPDPFSLHSGELSFIRLPPSADIRELLLMGSKLTVTVFPKPFVRILFVWIKAEFPTCIHSFITAHWEPNAVLWLQLRVVNVPASPWLGHHWRLKHLFSIACWSMWTGGPCGPFEKGQSGRWILGWERVGRRHAGGGREAGPEKEKITMKGVSSLHRGFFVHQQMSWCRIK